MVTDGVCIICIATWHVDILTRSPQLYHLFLAEDADEPIVLNDNDSEYSDIELSEREAGRSISVHTNDGSASKKCENQSSLNTPPTSMASADTG